VSSIAAATNDRELRMRRDNPVVKNGLDKDIANLDELRPCAVTGF